EPAATPDGARIRVFHEITSHQRLPRVNFIVHTYWFDTVRNAENGVKQPTLAWHVRRRGQGRHRWLRHDPRAEDYRGTDQFDHPTHKVDRPLPRLARTAKPTC